MKIHTEFDHLETVYIKSCPDQLEWMINGVIVRGNCVIYELSRGTHEATAHEFELTRDIDTLKKITS